MILKTANKYQIIWQCHNFKNILVDDYQHNLFFIKQKFCKDYFLMKQKIANCKDETSNHSNIY